MPPRSKPKAPRSSSTGGLGPAGGVGLEGQVLGWLAAHCLGQRLLPPDWIPSGLVTAVGSQTAQGVDDIGALTAAGGHVLVQSKKALGLGNTSSSPLGKALHQVVAQYLHGVPDGPDGALRPLDPQRDCLVIVTDGAATRPVWHGLTQAATQLATLPPDLPFTQLQGEKGVHAAAGVLIEHLRRELKDQTSAEPSDLMLREVLRVLRVHVMHLDDGRPDCNTARQGLSRVLADQDQETAALHGLELICQGLARDRTYWGTRDRLAGLLERDGFALGPDPTHAADVRALASGSRQRAALLRDEAQIRVLEQSVRLTRAVEPLLADWDGNLALVGGAGAGKTEVALQSAHILIGRGEDVVFLAGDAVAGTEADARTHLQIRAPLAEVLLAWRGPRPGTVIIDGLDITRLSDSSRWLLDLVLRLGSTRWRVLATVRSYSLRYGPDWQEVFRGEPVEASRQDPTLPGVCHLLIEDLTDDELAPLLAASPQLAARFQSWPATLTGLLHNPFNLMIAATLISDDPGLPLDGIGTRHGLLSAYWQRRITRRSDRLERVKTLSVLTTRMVSSRRPRVTDPVSELEAGLLRTLDGLLDDDVLREDPPDAWAAAVTVGYSHPVLFDYAVAQLVLGRAGQPLHLLDKLTADPDLAVIARPALDFHLAALWHGNPGRQTYWLLAVSLDDGGRGHALASLAAAAVALQEGLRPGDLDPLAEACDQAGPMAGRSGDARRLLAQIAGVMLTRDVPAARRDEAVPVIADTAARLATSAQAKADVDLARLAVVILHRVKAAAGPEPATAVSKVRDRAAAAAIRVALAHPAGAAARDLAQRTGELIADAAIRDPRSYAGLVSQVADEAYLQTWGMTVVFHLLRQLPALGRAAPAEAQQLVMAVWDYEVTDDGPEPLSNSRIMTLTFTKSGEVDTARYETSHQFPDWLRAAPAGAVDSYLKLVSKQAPPLRSAAGDPQRARPQVRLSHSLRSAAGHNALPDMTTALAEYLACLPGPGSGDEAGLLPHLLDQLAARLTHHETWVTLLSAGARAPRSLGAAFLPLLEQGELLTSQATFPAAAQLVAAVSPVLDPAAHLRLEHRLHAVGGDQADQLLGCFKEASIGLDATRERLAGLQAAGGPPVPPPLPSETGYPFFAFARGELPRDPGAALPDDQPLAAAMTAVRAALPSPGSAGGAEDEDGGAELRAAFPNLAAAAGSQKVSDPGYDEARELLCAAADALARDPQLKPGTELGDLVLHVLLDGLPPGPAPETETT
jgi:hypothetical protein